MDGLSVQTMTNRMNNAIREKVERRAQEQRRSLMYLVAGFLRQHGLHKSCETLTEEAHLTNNFEICDNVDLEIILNEYTDYYQARFQKQPQLCKRVADNQVSTKDVFESPSVKDNKRKPKATPSEPDQTPNKLNLVVTPLSRKISPSEMLTEETNDVFGNEKFIRPLGNLYPAGSEWREIAETITREIVMRNLNVHWDDIHGLTDCKESLKEAIVYPTKYPQLFSKLFPPWKGILLYGPPGTGKTMLAKAVATESDLTFFNITASSLVSKWRGDSEKYIRVLFELANYHAPSIIFIDEIDWIATGDGTSGSDKSEPARRFRAELLSRLDGLLSDDNSRVILLAATNAPWNLDSALLRRLEQHVQVDVPDASNRSEILQVYTAKRLHKTEDFRKVVIATKGYSGADLKRLCKEAWMAQMRPIWDELENENLAEYKKPEQLIKTVLIKNCQLLLESTGNILCTAKIIENKYQEWKQKLTTNAYLVNTNDDERSEIDQLDDINEAE